MMNFFQNLLLAVALFIAILSYSNANSFKRQLTPEKLEKLQRNVQMYIRQRNSEPSTNSTNHGSDDTHESGGGEGGHSNPSYMLKPHSYSYEPQGYKMSMHEINSKSSYVSFTYNNTDSPYSEYIFRVRFHGEHEYATEKQVIEVGDNGTNKLILKKFEEEKYIVCVTLLSTNDSVAPLSTSGMCVDVLIGEKKNGHGAVTGLLSPLLLAVAAVMLVFIAFIDYFKKKYIDYKKKKLLKQKIQERRESLHPSAAKKKSVDSEPKPQMMKHELSRLFHQVERRGSVWDERVSGRLVRLTEDNEPHNNTFHNPAYSTGLDEMEQDQNQASVDTLRHLLNSKPWVTSKPMNGEVIREEEESSRPAFYLQQA